MASQVQTRTGFCATHGTVQATRELPKIQFPFIVYGVRRYMARRRPFLCPTCGAEVATS
jgi:hypothetical protein